MDSKGRFSAKINLNLANIFIGILMLVLISGLTSATGVNEGVKSVVGINVTPIMYNSFDLSGNSPDPFGLNNCSLNTSTSVPWSFAGSRSYYFSRVSSYSECKNTNLFTINRTNATICMAIMQNNSISSQTNRLLYVYNESGGRKHQWAVSNTQNTTTFTMQNGSQLQNSGQDTTYYTSVQNSIQVWYDYCYVVNRSAQALYSNGVLSNRTTGIGRTIGSTTYYAGIFRIGGINGSNEFNGSIDEFRAYPIDLSAAKISQEHYDLSKGVRSYDNLSTRTSINVTYIGKSSIYVCGQKPTESIYNHTEWWYNASGGILNLAANNSNLCQNITGLSPSTQYSVIMKEYAHNGVGTAVSAMITNTTPGGGNYYVCNNGTDTNPGTEASPIATIKKVNTLSLGSGDSILWCCNGFWRIPRDAYPVLDSGITDFNRYQQYGDCIFNSTINSYINSPKFNGANISNSTGEWHVVLANFSGNLDVWESPAYPYDVGNLCMRNCTIYAYTRNWSITTLISDHKNLSWYDNMTGNHKVYLIAEDNPVSLYGNIEIWIDHNMFDFNGVTNFALLNITGFYGGRHFISGSNSNQVIIQGTNGHHIGGGYSSGQTRLGNGIELYRNNDNHLIADNRLWEIYDAAMTLQATSGTNYESDNDTYRNNVVWNSSYCFEYFQADPESNVTHILVDHNTCYNMGNGWFKPQRYNYMDGVCFRSGIKEDYASHGINFTNNICSNVTESNTDAYMVRFNDPWQQWQNRTVLLIDNNLYWGYPNPADFALWGPSSWYTYNDTGDWRSATGFDNHSIEANPLFISVDNKDFRPTYGLSSACNMSTSGGYVGALPCANTNPDPISGLTDISINNDTIELGWSWPSIVDLDHVEVWRSGNNVYNISYPSAILVDSGLASSTSYYYDFIVVDFGGLDSANVSATYMTTGTNATYPPFNESITGSGYEYSFLYEFLQKPYIINAIMNVSVSGIDSHDNTPTAVSVYCTSGIVDCSKSNDGDYATHMYIPGTSAGIVQLVEKNFTNYLNYTNTTIYAEWQVYIRSGTAQMDCVNPADGSEIILGSFGGTGVYLTYEINYTIDSRCRTGNQIQIRYYLNNGYASGTLWLTEAQLFTDGNYSIRADDIYLLNSNDQTDSDNSINFTETAQSITDSDLLFRFKAIYDATFDFNISIDLVYNATINVSVYENNTLNLLNPSCTFNGLVYYPKAELLNYTSTMANMLYCTLPFYDPLNITIIPTALEYNYSMRPQNRTLSLIEERTGAPFDITNCSSAIMYYEDNRTAFDFKSNNTNKVNFTALDSFKLRIELIYYDGTIITRYVNLGLIDDTDVKVCADYEGTTYYEQILVSSTSRGVVFKNVYSDCVIAADYTRFSYQNTKSLKAYSINSLYYLYTWDDDGNQVLLTSIDGSKASQITLDMLLLQLTKNIPVIKEDNLVVTKNGDGTATIYYYNSKSDNTAANIEITNPNDNTLLLNTSSILDPNLVAMLFDYSALGLNDSQNAKITLTKTKEDGTTEVEVAYLNGISISKSIPSQVALLLSVIFFLFGITLLSSESTYNFFGILIILVSLAMLGMATYTWYIGFAMAGEVIMLVFVGLVISMKTPKSFG